MFILEKDLSYRLGGLFFEIQRQHGRFCREKQYGDALVEKLKEAGIEFRREYPIEIAGIKSNFADFCIENRVLIELKARPFIEKIDYYQMLRYLEASDLPLGLIVNFCQPHLKPKRVLNYKLLKRQEIHRSI